MWARTLTQPWPARRVTRTHPAASRALDLAVHQYRAAAGVRHRPHDGSGEHGPHLGAGRRALRHHRPLGRVQAQHGRATPSGSSASGPRVTETGALSGWFTSTKPLLEVTAQQPPPQEAPAARSAQAHLVALPPVAGSGAPGGAERIASAGDEEIGGQLVLDFGAGVGVGVEDHALAAPVEPVDVAEEAFVAELTAAPGEPGVVHATLQLHVGGGVDLTAHERIAGAGEPERVVNDLLVRHGGAHLLGELGHVAAPVRFAHRRAGARVSGTTSSPAPLETRNSRFTSSTKMPR